MEGMRGRELYGEFFGFGKPRKWESWVVSRTSLPVLREAYNSSPAGMPVSKAGMIAEMRAAATKLDFVWLIPERQGEEPPEEAYSAGLDWERAALDTSLE
ncbi:hypothetical protein TIFTF001_006778 [Ficus carica]|uniref:Uncharacterized protein n=1 Tax=Ficus carica TaxID=3494 RepID=A0AA88DG04_FICCA|nr:hypothetical protein TIFTF001_006778 [Ficus carica]